MENNIEQHKNAVEAFEYFIAYISHQIAIYNLANDTGYWDSEIELMEKIKQSAINYSSLYREK